MDLDVSENNFASSTASTRTYRPTDIVLLEEADLYRYHDLPMDPNELSTAPTVLQSVASRSAVGSKRAASIDTVPSQYGAIRPGAATNLLARDSIGLLCNWFIIGFFNGGYPALLQPLFLVYLNYEGYRANSVLVLFSLAWYFKFVFGFISDCIPINRQRRKPYMLLGWSIFAIFMLALACMRKVRPFVKDGEIFNEEAPSQGSRYVVSIMLASFAHLLATVASEGFMIEVAHREGEYERGRTQCFTIIARFSGELIVELMTTFDVIRSQYLWVGVQQLSMAILTINWIVPPLVFVEIAEPGYEATCYGILTTLGNVAVVVMNFTMNIVSATYSPEVQDIEADTHEVRWHVASQFLVKAAVAIGVALCVLPLLPKQKRHVKEIKLSSSPNLIAPIVLFTVFLGLFVAALVSTLLSVFESTACLRFAGGQGCDQVLESRATSFDTAPTYFGAIRPGGPVDLFTKDYIGLPLNWVIIGFFNGAIPSLVYPLFYNYLNYQGYQADAVLTLFDLAWYFKFIFGFITDTIPINRQRRKPYMYLGWTLFAGFMLAMTVMHKVEPYMKDGEVFNEKARSQGPRYVVPIMISSFAHLLATVSAEGMMIELAHREGDPEYGGNFEHSVPLSIIFGAFTLISLLGVVVTKFFLREDPLVTSRQRFTSQMRVVWRFIEQRATWQIMALTYVLRTGTSFQVVEIYDIVAFWLAPEMWVSLLSTPLYRASTMVVALIVMRWMLNTSWRASVVTTVILAKSLMLTMELLTTFGVVRNHVFWLVPTLIAVEIAEPGYEATCYGLFTTLANVAGAVTGFTRSIVAASFTPAVSDVKSDTSQVRWHIATEFLVKYSIAMAAVLIVWWLLPRQKQQLRELKADGRPNLVIPIVLFIVFLALFAAALTSTILAVFEDTACLRFAGGRGCGNG
ncbi:hypothetical protein ATCC90586_001149 [Pythium insidiosum]|nr:hypothetical protein ATCC90586_001149 [Pythium insidiosum]